MSKTAGHTAAEWKPDSTWHIVGARTMVHIHDANGYIGVSLPDKTVEDRRRNEYLVTAVNSHASNLRKVEALRDALRRTLNVARGYVELCKALGEIHAEADRVIEEAAGALALAEEQV